MKLSRIFALILLASTTVAAVQDPAHLLLWRPKQGQDFKYGLSLETNVASLQVVFSAELALKVKAVEKNGDYTIESSYTKPTLTVDGQSQDIGDTAQDKPDVEKFNAKGERIDAGKDDPTGNEDDPFSKALGSVMDFNAPENPVKIGDKWTKENPGNEKKKTRPTKVEYTASAVEKIGSIEAVKVQFTLTEKEGDKPLKAAGAFYIDSSDGSLVKMNATIDNLKLDEESPVATAKVKVERKT